MTVLSRTKTPHTRRGDARAAIAALLTVGFVGCFAFASYGGQPPQPKKATTPPTGGSAGLSAADVTAFSDRFVKELWPAMVTNCLPCHGSQNASQFLLPKEPRAAFLRLVAEGQFDEANHASVVHRVTTTEKNIIMPPASMGTLPRDVVAKFEKFSEDLNNRRAGSGVKPDELFPAYLELPYTGKKPTPGLDNTFLTFRQLRGKVKSIFNDDWMREDRDLWNENVHLFGGADFIKRFDETSKAAPTFLTAVDIMGRDVASRAYLAHTGPFVGFLDALPSPVGMKTPTPQFTASVNTLFRRMLFRDATPDEVKQTLAFMTRIYERQQALLETAPEDVRFALTVTDDAGQSVSQDIVVRSTYDTHALRQEYVDQSQDADEGAATTTKTATRWLKGQFTFAPSDDGQKVALNNAGTHGNVSIASITLRGPLPAITEKVITVEDPGVIPEGAWKIRKEDNLTSYEDNNENKGSSEIAFPIAVTAPGKYEVAVTWRRFKAPPQKGKGRQRGAPTSGADNVLIEVVSRDKESVLALPAPDPIPPKGEAHFSVDQSIDNRPYADLKTAFQFGPEDGITIRNDGTRKMVTADAIRLLPLRPNADEVAQSILLRGADAVGKDKWGGYQKERFSAYNTIGPELFTDMNDKGEKTEGLALTYLPAKAAKTGFDPSKFYRIGVVYPGKVDNDTNVPVVIKAKASSPIVQVIYPYHAHVGAPVTVDASQTYNLQRSKLTFHWIQIGGPKVALTDPTAPKLTFKAPAMGAQQAAWEGLCRALLGHPDFLFTRPRSLATATDAKTRRRLQLVKMSQDLLARTPTPAEIAEVDTGKPLAGILDRWLDSKEFTEFYFHRTRLYLESHGTAEQDEPARLWTFVAMHDRPFKEILTADYTVDPEGKKVPRPSYFGHTGVLTMPGFIKGKPGLPHFNYPAQVLEKFMGYVFEVPDAVLQMRDGITASATTDPTSVCYTCHKVLTPLAYQRLRWDDDGNYRAHDDTGLMMDDSDQNQVLSYPYRGEGMEAFATQAQNKERFIRTILQTHFVWYFGRELRFETDERSLYKRLWDVSVKANFAIRPLIKTIMLSPEYLSGSVAPPTQPVAPAKPKRTARLIEFHARSGVEM